MSPPPADAPQRSMQFYRWLFGLDRHTTPDVLLTEALRFIVDETRASLVYVELFDDKRPGYQRAAYANDGPSADNVRSTIAQSVMLLAISERRLVTTPSAVVDVQFEDAGTIRRTQVHAAVCAPIVEPGGGLVGVVYLQGPVGAPAFGELANERILALAQALAGVATRLQLSHEKLTYHRMMDEYAASLVCEAHRRNGTNATAAARDLSIDRKTFYRFRYRKP